MAGVKSTCSVHRTFRTIFFLASVTLCFGQQWPVPPKKYDKRPSADPRCMSSSVAFCPSGVPPNFMPTLPDNDSLVVYVMSHPDDSITLHKKDSQSGKLLKEEYVSQHYALGFHHVQTGLNMTLEWYEMQQLINCTIPSDLSKFPFTWCNQAATCLSMGIDDVWSVHGSLNKVSEITGAIFNKFANWTLSDNATYPYYSTWTVMDKPGGQTWFAPLDRAIFMDRVLKALHSFNVTFDPTKPPIEYDKLVFYSQKPIAVSSKSASTQEKLAKFFSIYAEESNLKSVVEYLRGKVLWWYTHPTFYHYFNEQYWELKVHAGWEPLKSPFEVVRDYIPLPQ